MGLYKIDMIDSANIQKLISQVSIFKHQIYIVEANRILQFKILYPLYIEYNM